MNLRRSSLGNRVERIERELFTLKSLVDDLSDDQTQIRHTQRQIVDAIVKFNDVLKEMKADVERLKVQIGHKT